jgi:hypothetical protein
MLTAAGALAGVLLRPGGALAAFAGPPPARLSERWLGGLTPGQPRTVRLARSADLVGLQWQEPALAAAQLRFRLRDGSWSRWASADAHGHGPDGAPVDRAHVGEPLWTGGTRELQLRVASPLRGVRLHLVDVSGGLGARLRAGTLGGRASAAGALALAPAQYAAGPGAPPVIARRVWAQGSAPPRVTPRYGAVRVAFVHHTENPNGYSAGEVPAMLRAIYAFHRYVNGWDDIGYNFVIDLYGRIFEARAGGIEEPVVGAHAGGYNLYSTGVAVLGSFMSTPISTPARIALQRLLAWKLSLHGVPARGHTVVKVNPAGSVYSRFPANAPVSLPRIAGHRDGDSTDCPGDVLYGELPSIRSHVLTLAPRPVRVTLALAPAPVPAGPAPPSTPPAPAPTPTPAPAPTGAPAPTPTTPPAAAAGRGLAGTLAFSDGTPIAGATVLVQVRTVGARGESVLERTIGEAPTDAAGRFSLAGTFLPAQPRAVGAWLRAVFVGTPGAGASISEPLHVAAAPPLSPPAAPAPTPGAGAPPAR